MNMTFTLAVVAAGVGALHTLAPDHWVPFAALARAERWSARRTAGVTAACGLGHVTVSVLLGLVSLALGVEVMSAFGERLESVAGLLLIGFGVVYALWGLHHAMRARIHDRMHDVLPSHEHPHGPQHHHHHHHHHHGVGGSRRTTPFALFLLFSADPCVAVVPLMFAAAPLGWISTLVVVAVYELATISTMVGLALPARAAVSTVTGDWADRYGDAVAGALIASVGLFVAAVGI
jgi:ABC-type nickel/cobalt efflux system permease component RcnA